MREWFVDNWELVGIYWVLCSLFVHAQVKDSNGRVPMNSWPPVLGAGYLMPYFLIAYIILWPLKKIIPQDKDNSTNSDL